MSLSNHYIIVIIGIMVFVTGLFSKLYIPVLWDWFSAIDTASAVATVVIALIGYKEYLRMEDEIKIFFDVEGELIDTGITILRKNFTRSEIMGLLGMIQTDQKQRFKLSALYDRAILRKIHEIQKSKGKSFTIKMTKEEFKEFNI